MNITLTEAFVIAGVLIIVGLFVDGMRRVRSAKKGALDMKLDALGKTDDIDLFKSGESKPGMLNTELPSGGARRVVDKEAIGQAPVASDEREAGGACHVHDASDVDTAPLMLDDAVAEDPATTFIDPSDSRVVDETLKDLSARHPSEEVSNEKKRERVYPSGVEPKRFGTARVVKERIEPTLDGHELSGHEQGHEPDVASASSVSDRDDWEEAVGRETTEVVPEVMVLHVMAKGGQFFEGESLVKAMLACGLRFGDMRVFHMFENQDRRGEILFSVANAIEPGIFDPDTIQELATPGVSMFLSLPGPAECVHAFDTMIDCARTLAKTLHGEVLDGQRNVMSEQAIEQSRERVIEFARKANSHTRDESVREPALEM